MQTKQPAHKLVLLLLCGLFYLTACMDSNAKDKDDNSAGKRAGVKIHISLPPDKSGRPRWDTTFVRKFSDTSAYMIVMPDFKPMAVRSSTSDSIGGSAPDTIYLQTFSIDKGDSKKDDDDDK